MGMIENFFLVSVEINDQQISPQNLIFKVQRVKFQETAQTLQQIRFFFCNIQKLIYSNVFSNFNKNLKII